MDELVAIAKIVKPRGLRGEVTADVLTDFPDRFEGLDSVIALFADGTRKDLKIEDSWFQKDRIVFRFAGFDSIEAAEKLRGVELCVPESDATRLDEGEFFDWQLKGCEVETVDGDRIGIVSSVLRTGGTEILVVEGSGKEYLIPFAATICTDVDVDKKIIRVDPPEGLLEF